MAEVKLFGFFVSPFSSRVKIALKLKGVEYEYIEEDMWNKSPLLLHYNPVHKKVPVLVHKGQPIAESSVILEYIDETWKDNPILPEDPYERAMARFWAKFVDKECTRAMWKACRSEENDREKAVGEAFDHLKKLENELKDKRFFGGENMGLVDIVANFLVHWLGALEEASGVKLLTKEKFPILHRWIDEYVNCSSVKENLPPKDILIAYFRSRF